jgi:hypothetical protein
MMTIVGAGDDRVLEIIHELNNALGLVINYATLLTGDLADQPNLANDLTQIHTAGRRAADLVGELAEIVQGPPEKH